MVCGTAAADEFEVAGYLPSLLDLPADEVTVLAQAVGEFTER